MELRPRKGRSSQPSTPSAAKPSPRQPSQSASRRKPANVPPSPLYIPSDDEAREPKHGQADSVGLSPALFQNNHEGILLAETPLSEFVTSEQKARSSALKKEKKKTAVSAKKKVAEVIPIAQQDTSVEDACTNIDYNTTAVEVVHLDDTATGDRVIEIELGGEKPVRRSKKTQSSKKRSAAKSGKGGQGLEGSRLGEVAHEARDGKVDQVDDQEHFCVANASFVADSDRCHHKLLLTLSDDENDQDLGKLRKSSGCTLKEDVKAQALTSSKIKSLSNKENFGEERLKRNLFEETTSDILFLADIEPDGLITHVTGKEANQSKEEETGIDAEEAKKSDRIVRSTCEAQCSSEALKDTNQLNIQSFENDEKCFEKPDVVITEEGIGYDCTQIATSIEVLRMDPFSGIERGGEKGRGLGAPLEVKLDKMKGVARHVGEQSSSLDDNDSNASSGSDEDEADLGSIFASSMKAHLHISEPSVFDKHKAMQSEQDAQKGENPTTKDAIKGSPLNGNISRSGGSGLSWSPKVALSGSQHCRSQQGRFLETRPSKIWEKDRCLLDGLCVPPVDPVKLNKLARKQKKDTTGNKWYNLSAPTITPELKKELQLVKLRGVLDPKRHYKAEDSKGLPKYFQVGTVIGGPADFYSGRLTKKEQKNSLANELLSNTSLSVYRKRKYLEIQDQKQAGGKGFMKKKKSKRTPAWAKV
ncbi:hypothetical protein L7F22_060681 [Adiantum nelumboides]|nr:hypothetical protein [Adiantum nelumboides]